MECPFEPRKAVDMTRDELLERYEALGEERDFEAARPQFEQALAEEPDARVLSDYGYLLESHARRELVRAVEVCQRAIELDPRTTGRTTT